MTDELLKRIFLEQISGWNNHLPLLYYSLGLTQQGKVIEMGMGYGSTQQLHDYCEYHNRRLISFETDEQWSDKFEHLNSDYHNLIRISNKEDAWNFVHEMYADASVVLIDHAHGERRHIDLDLFRDSNGIIVCHDSEPHPCGGNYQWNWQGWKYKVNLTSPFTNNQNGTWASAVSNYFDVRTFAGREAGTFKIEV